jgi:outer membrane protein TolC
VLSSGLTFSAIASLPIYEGGWISSNVSQAKSARDEARSNLEETLLEVEQVVRQQHLDLQTARRTISTAESRLAQAQEAYDISGVRYEAGVGTAVEVADALSTLAAARTNLDQARFNYNIAYARLQGALGLITF